MQSIWRSFTKAGAIRRSLVLLGSQCPRMTSAIGANFSTSFLNNQEFLKGPIVYAQNRYMRKKLFHVIQTRKTFYVEVHDDKAVLSYEVLDGIMTIKHTNVPQELGGLGIGKLLAKAALEYALRNEFFLIINCKFVNHYINNYEPQYAKYMLR